MAGTKVARLEAMTVRMMVETTDRKTAGCSAGSWAEMKGIRKAVMMALM